MNARKRTLYILTFLLFVVMLGYGLIIPIFLFYIESMGAGGMANTYVTILLTTALFALTVSVISPALLSLTSRKAGELQGTAMGLSNSIVSLGRIVGPIVGGALLDIHVQLPYQIGTALMLIGLLISFFWVAPREQEPVAVH